MRILLLALLLIPEPPPARAGCEIGPAPPRDAPVAPFAEAGDSTIVRRSLHSSIGLHQMRDDLLAPLRYGAPAPDLGVRRERTGFRCETSLEVGAGSASSFKHYGHRAAGPGPS